MNEDGGRAGAGSLGGGDQPGWVEVKKGTNLRFRAVVSGGVLMGPSSVASRHRLSLFYINF